jgi:hypothetical protein
LKAIGRNHIAERHDQHQIDAGQRFRRRGGRSDYQNRLFFFGAIDPSWETRTSLVPPDFPLLSTYPDGLDRKRRTTSYSAKATYQLSNSHRFDASFFGDPSKGENGPQRGSALLNKDTSSFSSLTYGGHNQTVRYDGVLSSNFLLEGFWARALNDINEVPSGQHLARDRSNRDAQRDFRRHRLL